MLILIESALRTLLVALCFWFATKLLRIRNPHILRTGWVVTLFVSLSMPLLMQTANIRIPATAIASSWALPEMIVVATQSEAPRAWFVGFYVAIASVLLLRLAFGFARTWKLCANAQRLQEKWIIGHDVRITAAIHTPVTVASTILLPTTCQNWDAITYQAVLAHEGAHVRHRDFYVQLLAQLHRSIFWFSPLAWWLPRQLSELSEVISDEAAINRIADRSAYANILFAMARNAQHVHAAVAMANRATVASRIERVLTECRVSTAPNRLTKLWIVAAITPFIALAASSSIATNTEVNMIRIVRNEPMSEASNSRKNIQGDRFRPPRAPSQGLTLPPYPADSRLNGQAGTTWLNLYIGKDGSVLEVQIQKSSGFTALDTAAVNTAHEWRLIPAMLENEPQAAWAIVPVVFKLAEDDHPN